MDMEQLDQFARDLAHHAGIQASVVYGDPQSILQIGDKFISFWFDFERGYVGCTGPDASIAHAPTAATAPAPAPGVAIAVEVKPAVAEAVI